MASYVLVWSVGKDLCHLRALRFFQTVPLLRVSQFILIAFALLTVSLSHNMCSDISLCACTLLKGPVWLIVWLSHCNSSTGLLAEQTLQHQRQDKWKPSWVAVDGISLGGALTDQWGIKASVFEKPLARNKKARTFLKISLRKKTGRLSLDFYFIWVWVFACTYVCIQLKCLVLAETREGIEFP